MKIGVVTDFYYPWIGGPSTVIRTLGHGLAARGHSVSLLAPSSTGKRGREADGPIEITRVATVPAPFGYNLRTALWPRREVLEWMTVGCFDVIHVHHPFPLSAMAVHTARSLGIPVVATNHTIPACSLWGIRNSGALYRIAHDSFARWLIELLGRCDAVATPTETAAEALYTLGFNGFVEPISNGIDTRRFHPGTGDQALRQRLGLDNRPVVLYTGRLDGEKQMDVWLRAAAEMRVRDVQFLIGGKGTEREHLDTVVKELGLGDRTHFFGYLDDDEFPLVYRLADVYFITSPVELQSIATLEAVASGLPVVAVRAGALPELVHNELNGYLVPSGNSHAAANALEQILANEARRTSMAAASRTIALKHDLERTVVGYERFLRRLAING